jgi:GH24 family phage-related lysozyme (muramidase)
MPPLQPLQQTIFEQGPQSSVGMGASPIVDYREDPTVIVNPINPALALDNGVAWYALGAEAFNVAGKLYEETLDNVIEGKDASIQAIGYDLQNKTDDLYQNFQIRLQQAEIAGTDLTQEDQVILNKGYEDLKNKYDEQARGVLGDEDYARFTQGNPDLSDIGSKYRRLALQTRKSYYDIENNITKVMYNMASATQNLIEKNEGKIRFAAGNQSSSSRQPPMTDSEIGLNVPYNPMINGMYPVTGNGGKSMMPVGKDGTEFGRDSAGEILVDEFKQPVLVKGKDGEFYLNPNASKSVLSEDNLRMLAMAEAENGQQTSSTGKIIHPAAQKAFKGLVTGRLSDADAFMVMSQLRYVDINTVSGLVNDDGSPSFSADQVMRLSVLHNMSRNSATGAMLKRFQEDEARNPEALTIAYKYANSLMRGSKTMEMEGRIDRVGTEETIYGSGQDQTALATITNAVVLEAAKYSGVNLDTYTTGALNIDVKVAGEGTSNESIVDFLDRNPQMKITIARAYLAVQSNPSITKGGTADTDKTRSNEINKFLKGSFLPAEFAAANLTVIDGVVISSKSLHAVEEQAAGLNGIVTSANITEAQKEAMFAMTKDERRKLVAQAELRGTNGSKILGTDTKQVAFDKQVTYIGHWNPSANKQVIATMIDAVGQTQVNRRGTTTAKNGLSDGELARIAMAANPAVYAALGLVPNTPDAAAKVRAMSTDEQLTLAAQAWKLIPSAENWQMELDLGNRDQLEGNNAGIPVSFSAISAQTTTGTNVNLIDSLTSRDNLDANGGYMFRQRDNNSTPIVRIGQRIDVNGKLMSNTERDMNLTLKDIIEAQAEGSTGNRETVLRGSAFPSRTDTGATDDVRAIEAIKISKIQENRINFAKLFETSGIDNPPVTSVVDLMNQLDLPKTRAGRATLRKLDPTFKDDVAGTSILDTITTDYRRATQPNTGELRTGAGDPDGKGNYADALFTPAMMDAVMAKAKGLGLTTVSDHLSLLFAVASEYRGNSEFDMGYNMKEYRASTAQMFTESRTDDKGEDQETYPETIPMGPKFGMILYDENSASFLPTLEGLIEAGSSIYTKTGTTEYYAFVTPPTSPDFVLYHSAADQITPAVEGTADTMVTTTERALAPAPQGGWNGWGPRYENVIKTTGTKGTPAQAATGKSTDLTKAFEKNRLHRLFLAEAQKGDDYVGIADPNAYVAKEELVEIQSDISRILAADWKTIKETPAALAKGVVELENFGKGTPVQEMRLEQRKSANDFGQWARTKMMEPAMAAMLASYKETGSVNFMETPAVAGLALRAAFYSFFGMDEDVVNNLSHDQALELQKTIEAAPNSKIKNITLTAVELLHKEHMAAEGHSAIPATIAAPAKDFVTIAPAAVGEPKDNPDVEEPTVQVSTITYPVSVQPNGSLLSVAMMPYQTKGGPTVLIPTVKNGKPMDSKAAVAEYTKTGQHFGIFSTVEKATTYAKALEVEQTTSIKTREKLWFDVIKTYEGFEAKAYNKDGKWTVGAGSTTHPDGTPVKKGDVVDAAKADMYVRHYTYNTVIPTLRNTIPKWDKMNANQQAALISFAYNMGPNFYGAKNRETITAALKSPLTWYKVPAILPLYNKATSQTSGKLVVLQGLVKRRKAEANLWNQTK